jgi:hypothetical protein
MVFSDLRFVVEEIIDARGEDGNGMVGVRARMHGVHTGEFFGIAPTGRESEVRTHDFHQIVTAGSSAPITWRTGSAGSSRSGPAIALNRPRKVAAESDPR